MKKVILLLLFFSFHSWSFDQKKITENFVKLGGSEEAITQALCFYSKYKGQKFKKKIRGKLTSKTSITNKKFIVVQDLTMPSKMKRLFLVNLRTSEVLAYYAAHGSGNIGEVTNNTMWAEFFSNRSGSNLTPRGFFISGERVVSTLAWKWHMKLDGIEIGLNDNSRDRAIVFHSGVASYDENEIRVSKGVASSREENPVLVDRFGAQFMSNGCTMVSKYHSEDIYEKTKAGTLFYNFTEAEKKEGTMYCGSHNLVR